ALVINIVVLLPVIAGLILDANWITQAYGPKTPARQILLSIYLAIFVLSIALILMPNSQIIIALLTIQIIYKITTPFTVNSWRNPVVVSNLIIAISFLILISIFFGFLL
ncbi:hypothetical protein, partial [Legionella cherrii]|uniref:hypothetical protein n=1 Tax=Legionella cherrii TaxID=28084 RepID=UPI001ED98CDF